MSAVALAEVFRLLQAGKAEEALQAGRRITDSDRGNARAHLAQGLALRMLGRLEESHLAIQEATRLDPGDYGAAYELGVALELRGDAQAALASYERSAQMRPEFAAAHAAIGLNAFARADWPRAIRALQAAATLDPGNAALAINVGLALAEAGEHARAIQVLDEVAARSRSAEAQHALGWALHKAKRTADAIAPLQAAVAAAPDPLWRVDLGKALSDLGRDAEAKVQFDAAVAAHPVERLALVTYGRFCVARGDFALAAELFRRAAAADPANIELPMYVAQVELLRGRFREGWRAYARREQRLLFEAEAQRRGVPYSLPAPGELAGGHVLITAEQGLGDELFFLRYAPKLRSLGARLSYQGDARLRPLLERTGLFQGIHAAGAPAPAGTRPLLTGDLPLLLDSEDTPATLSIAPDPARLEAMRRRLERVGPRPWTGVTWRAGTPRHVVSYALYKNAPIAGLFAAMPREGTVVSLQRDGHFDELEAASQALGRPIYDFSGVNADLDDALALVALLDRHIGVSNTNMHLAAAAGAVADVLAPFPPEWRWGIAGDSPWFPGFRIYRQRPDGDWARAYAELANAGAGSRSRA